MITRFLISLLFFTLWTVTAQGRMYRWVDENGVTVYSQSPPPSGQNATQIKPLSPPSTGEEEAWKDVERMMQKSSDLEQKRQIKADEKKKEEEKKQVKKTNCVAARRNLQVLQGSARARFRTPDGNYRRYTAEERRQKIEEAQAQVKQYCF